MTRYDVDVIYRVSFSYEILARSEMEAKHAGSLLADSQMVQEHRFEEFDEPDSISIEICKIPVLDTYRAVDVIRDGMNWNLELLYHKYIGEPCVDKKDDQ